MRCWVMTVRVVLFVVLAAAPLAAQTPDSPRVLDLRFDELGRVNLTAHHVTVREILAEWGRQCGCYVVNAEQLPGEPLALPIQFESAPQNIVLESLLRQAAGYVLTPKRPGVQSASNYETIYILATSNPIAGAYVPPPPMSAGPPLPTAGAPDDEIPPVLPVGMVPNSRPQPQPTTQPANTSNPFTTSGPNVFAPASPFGRSPGTAPTPGAPTPAPGNTNVPPPPMPMPVPGGTVGPTPSGAPVPIVPVPPQGQ